MKQLMQYCVLACLLMLHTTPASCQEVFEAAQSPGVEAEREPGTVRLFISPEVKSPITIPRIAAPLNTMRVTTQGVAKELRLVPLQDKWEIHWNRTGEGEIGIEMHFDADPYLPTELKPTLAAGDGSFFLPAHRAQTYGEKLRYEPQPYKNTVGFWTGKNDYATWTIQLDKPGRFNVAVLQGCGKGQGGSQAVMKFISSVKDITPTIEFEVVETGHFQNFRWVHLGEVELRHAGEVEINVAPKQIKKAALMDIRAINLIRLPDKK